MTILDPRILTVLATGSGTALLCWEVWKAQRVEKLVGELSLLNRQMSWGLEMSDLLKTNPVEFWIRTQMELKFSREDAELRSATMSEARILAAVEPFRAMWEQDIPAAAGRLDRNTALVDEQVLPRVRRQRTGLLLLGFVLLMAGALLQLWEAMSSASGMT